MRRRTIAAAAIVAIAAPIAALAFFSPIDPVAWTPPVPVLAANACAVAPVAEASILAPNLPGQPDGLAFGADGLLRAALSNGEVIAVDPETGTWTSIADGGGFLTGLAVASDDTTYVVDEHAGALYEGRRGESLRMILDEVDGVRLRWTNDVTALPDGRLALTTTSSRRNLDRFIDEVMEHRGSGLLILHSPQSGEAQILRDDLQMTNGLAVDSNGSHLLVAESAMYGVRRIALDTGASTVLQGLPGFTGNVRAADRAGVYWVTVLSPRSPLVDGLAGFPLVRRVLAWLPPGLRPKPQPLACVIEITVTGETMTPRAIRIEGEGAMPSFSTAIERDGRLYLSPAGIVEGAQPALYVATLPAQ